MTKKGRITLSIVLDTNVLFTAAEDKLICLQLADLINDTKAATDVDLNWYLPSVVIEERRFQMLQRAMQLLSPIQKMEALLGHKLNITEEVLQERVDAAIKRQLEQFKLHQLNLDTTVVEWDKLITNSTKRLPPFETGNEKGLRDFFILEEYIQLVEKKPKSPQLHRALIISNDGLMEKAFSTRTEKYAHTELIKDLDALKTYINIHASTSAENLINEILPKANYIFWNPSNKENIWNQEDIGTQIYKNYSVELNTPPSSDGIVKTNQIIIRPSTFLAKNRQKISLSTKIIYSLEALYTRIINDSGLNQSPFFIKPQNVNLTSGINYPLLANQMPGVLDNGGLTTGGGLVPAGTGLFGLLGTPSLPLPGRETIEEKVEGKHTFEVIWEATITIQGKLIKPKIIEIKSLGSSWQTK